MCEEKNRLRLWAKLNTNSCENCRRNSTINYNDCLKILKKDPSIVYWGNDTFMRICPDYESYLGDKYPPPKDC